MGRYKLIAVPMFFYDRPLVPCPELLTTIKSAAGLPKDAEWHRTTFPDFQDIAVLWFWHPSFQDKPDYYVYEVNLLSRQEIQAMLDGNPPTNQVAVMSSVSRKIVL